jgi:hypothetical protein
MTSAARSQAHSASAVDMVMSHWTNWLHYRGKVKGMSCLTQLLQFNVHTNFKGTTILAIKPNYKN